MSSAERQANAVEPDTWTIRRILEWTADYFRDLGCESPRLDAELLLAHVLDCPRIQLYVRYDSKLSLEQRALMRDLVRRRAAYEPVAYLLGKREFYGLDFEVRSGVFIPRPETETLVVELVETLRDMPAARVLELCVGSACVAVAATVNLPRVHVTAVELNPEAMEVARRNADKHNVSGRIEFFQGDLYRAIPEASSGPFDAIVSNPPYVKRGELESLHADVRLHEPREALDGGEDGLDVFRRIIEGAENHLRPGGRLLIELSPDNIESALRFASAIPRLIEVCAIRDGTGQSRFLSAFRQDAS